MTDNQPTILVKKADGTTERITLAELKARQSGSAPSSAVTMAAPVVSTPVVEVAKAEEVKKVEPVIEKPRGLVIGPAEKNVLVSSMMVQNTVMQAPLKTADLKPLLHEEVPESPHAESNVVAARTDQVSKIVASLTFKVPAQYENRLKSCVQLRIKDIRSEVDTREMCLRSIKEGGLGLTQTQADELIEKTHPTTALSMKKNPEENKKTDRDLVVEKIIGQAPATSEIADLISPKKSTLNNSPIRSNVFSSTKPMVHDVQSKPVSMGPLDEIRYFSLTDLRRLSSQPSEAVSRLKQKFINLRDESFLLFMDSWGAWRSSPIYQNYIDVVDHALSNKTTLNAVLGSNDSISLAEVEALMKMEKELDI